MIRPREFEFLASGAHFGTFGWEFVELFWQFLPLGNHFSAAG